MDALQQARLRRHVKRWHPNKTKFAPRGNSDPTCLEMRARDAMRPQPHGEVKIFTRSEISTYEQERVFCVDCGIVGIRRISWMRYSLTLGGSRPL